MSSILARISLIKSCKLLAGTKHQTHFKAQFCTVAVALNVTALLEYMIIAAVTPEPAAFLHNGDCLC